MLEKNKISELLDAYIEYKCGLGFKLKHEKTVLKNFVNYTLENDYNGPLTKQIVLDWISAGKSKNKTMGRKIEVIRPFMKYASVLDSRTEIIYKNLYSNVHLRPIPYIFNEDEVLKLMDSCKDLYSPDGIRAKTTATVIGLLWSTGLRPSEASQLRIKDIDTTNHYIHIKNSKYNSERTIPIDPTVSLEIENYKSFIFDKLGVKESSDALFYTTGGVPLTQTSMSYAFKMIRKNLDVQPIGYEYIRLHDFRHTMASRTIKKWLEYGEDVNKKLYILSAYMDHKKPEDTYWYLSSTTDLLSLANEKYEAFLGGKYDGE